MPNAGSPVKFKFGLYSSYDPSQVDDNTVYFITDKNLIVLGNGVYSGSSNTLKYIGHYDSLDSGDPSPNDYLDYDELDKTNYACTIGDTNQLYVLDTSVTTPEWVKVTDNVVTTIEEQRTISSEVSYSSISSNFKVLNSDLVVIDRFDVIGNSHGPYYLSKIPDATTIFVGSNGTLDYTYDSLNNAITLDDSIDMTSISQIFVQYIRIFNLTLAGGSYLTPSLYYYFDNDTTLVFAQPPVSGKTITIEYTDSDNELRIETFVTDGTTSIYQLSYSLNNFGHIAITDYAYLYTHYNTDVWFSILDSLVTTTTHAYVEYGKDTISGSLVPSTSAVVNYIKPVEDEIEKMQQTSNYVCRGNSFSLTAQQYLYISNPADGGSYVTAYKKNGFVFVQMDLHFSNTYGGNSQTTFPIVQDSFLTFDSAIKDYDSTNLTKISVVATDISGDSLYYNTNLVFSITNAGLLSIENTYYGQFTADEHVKCIFSYPVS